MRPMARPIPISKVTIWQLAIPLRQRFRHAATERSVAEPLIVAVELADHTVGYGETHPRPYVTGETAEQAVATIRHIFAPLLIEMHPASFIEAVEAAANLPLTDAPGRVVTAARAAVELALLDAYSRAFGRPIDTIAGWLGEAWLGSPGSSGTARYSGVVSAVAPRRAAWSIRKMRLPRLPHFKLKVGDDDDDARVRQAIRVLHRGLESGRVTLRLDANGAWGLDEAAERLEGWQDQPILCVEQPLPKGEASAWGELACRTTLPLMADESLVTPADAEALIACDGAAWFNIRISKNGGLIPAVQLAMTARRHQIEYQLGCMVGETGILSAAARWFLQMVPGVQIVEGSFGTFLLSEDVTRPSVRFGFGGRWKPMTGPGLGVTVDESRLERLAITPPQKIPF